MQQARLQQINHHTWLGIAFARVDESMYVGGHSASLAA